MDEREEERLRMAREVGKLLLHRSFRDALPPLTKDGERPFVIGLPGGTMGEIARRVTALGGDAHLIVVTPGRVQVLRVTECEDRSAGDLDESREAPAGGNSSLAMLIGAMTVGQAFCICIHGTETVIRFISDSVQLDV